MSPKASVCFSAHSCDAADDNDGDDIELRCINSSPESHAGYVPDVINGLSNALLKTSFGRDWFVGTTFVEMPTANYKEGAPQ